MGLSKEQKENIKFHVENDDYFGTLATRLNIILVDGVGSITKDAMECRPKLFDIIEELKYIQDNFKIRGKSKINIDDPNIK